MFDRRQRLIGTAEMPLGLAQCVEQPGRSARLGLLVDQSQGRLDQRCLALSVTLEAVIAGGAPKDRRAVSAGQHLGIWHAIEQPDHAFEQYCRLAVGVYALRGVRSPHRGAKRRGCVPGRRIVMRDRGRDVDAHPVALRARLECPGDLEVDPRALPREQVIVDHLPQKRVAEAVPILRGDGEDLVGHRFAQRFTQRPEFAADHLGQQAVVELLADGDHPEDVLGGCRQPLDAHHHRVSQRRRQ